MRVGFGDLRPLGVFGHGPVWRDGAGALDAKVDPRINLCSPLVAQLPQLEEHGLVVGMVRQIGNASRSRLMTVGLVRRKKVLISISRPSVVTSALLVSCFSIVGSIVAALALSGSRSSVKRRLFTM